jgi:hypothetical protein
MATPKPTGAASPAAAVAATNAALTANIPQPKSPQELEAVLTMMRQPDTQKIAAAERILTKFMQKSPCVPAFMQQIVASQQVRPPSSGLTRLLVLVHSPPLCLFVCEA